MKRFEEYDVVRVTRLLTPHRQVDGTEGVMRQPEVGDLGTVVHILHDAGGNWKYMVECVDRGGMTVWLCDFDHQELEVQP